jgi:hypothetical protein
VEEAIILEDIQDAQHLAKYENTGTFHIQVLQSFVEEDHLARIVDNGRSGFLTETRR